jgi:hypothetical protein
MNDCQEIKSHGAVRTRGRHTESEARKLPAGAQMDIFGSMDYEIDHLRTSFSE